MPGTTTNPIDSTLAPAVAPEVSPALPHPQPGIALCLSGGAYRAMLFHVGSLWRLNEFGLLPRLQWVSSVSGGSITAGVLGMNWTSLGFDADGVAGNFQARVVEPVRGLARQTIDVGSVLGGVLNPFTTVADKVAGAYRQHLFGDRTPRFPYPRGV